MTKSNPDQDLWEKFLQHCQNEQITKKRQAKLLQMYRTCQRGLHNKLAQAGRPEIETFINKLNTDKFLRQDGKKFGGNSKLDIKKFLKQFFKWYKGMGEGFPQEVSWIKTRISKDERPREKDVLTKDQVVKLAGSFAKPEYRALTLLLFDSGFRIGEMYSVRKCDITWEAWDGAKKCWWIKCNKSKTFTRKVPLPLFELDITTFMNSPYVKAKEDNERLFDKSQGIYNRMLKVYSNRLFKLDIRAHHLRHSSATFYAEVLGSDLFKFADRMGWTYSATEFKTYVRKSKSRQVGSVEKIYTSEVQELKAENQALREQIECLRKDVMREVLGWMANLEEKHGVQKVIVQRALE